VYSETYPPGLIRRSQDLGYDRTWLPFLVPASIHKRHDSAEVVDKSDMSNTAARGQYFV
jgi:hypothetical protein